jgi:hypothetical protein
MEHGPPHLALGGTRIVIWQRREEFFLILCIFLCVCVCERERERRASEIHGGNRHRMLLLFLFRRDLTVIYSSILRSRRLSCILPLFGDTKTPDRRIRMTGFPFELSEDRCGG